MLASAMLKPKAQLNLANARDYFREHLCVGDYYAVGHTVSGEWIGQGAERLGLKGRVEEQAFLALCEGRMPATGERLGQRRNSVRREGAREAPNRRIFYDFTISPPKSVSVLALYQDERIVGLHNRAVRTALTELETFAEARVRKAGQRTERVTGNIVAACFRHDTSRELDPHLHTHCVAFNATFDTAENRWNALEPYGMYRAQKLAENVYYHELAKGLRRLGYGIENNARDFEIEAVPASVIARFSKRHRQIDDEARKQVARDGGCANVAELRERIAHDGRRRKVQDSTAERLRSFWSDQLSPSERTALAGLHPKVPKGLETADVAGVVAWADERVFERKAVVRDHELWSEALARGRGTDMDLAAIRAQVKRCGYIHEPNTRRITSPEVLRSEMAVVLAARQGRNWFAPLSPAHKPSSSLSAEQLAAVSRILGSQDFITLFRGGAGTGKSFALGEVRRGLESAGHPVVVLAPQRQQVAGLQADGLPAETLARCLQAKSVPPQAVVVVDEAGQVGARQLSRLVELVQAQGGRLILSGDTRQHGAVEASDALLAIERYSGAKPATIRQIHRQDPALAKSGTERRFVAAYRAAVKSAAAGRIGESFVQLDRLGCIREVAPDDRCAAVAKEYLGSVGRGERPLVVAQTRADVDSLNDAIRAEMAAKNLLGRSTALKTYQTVDLDQAQKRDGRFYAEGRFAYVLQGYGRFVRGDLCAIAGTSARGVVLVKNGRRSTMSYRYASRLVIAAEREIEVAPGDRLQLKFNGKAADGQALANGELVIVRRVFSDGSLAVESDKGLVKTLSPGQRLFQRGYAVTSYSSQGKTVDTVLVADSGCQAVADRRHWYVAISRARKRVLVFTPDREALRANIEHSGDRTLALDMALGATAVATPARRAERALAIMERSRRHDELMQRTAAAPQQRAVHSQKVAENAECWRIGV
jgi:conjugative relaxase-like TrwC/TraI family protein